MPFPLPPNMWIHYMQVQLLGPLEGNAARKIFQEHNEEKTLELLTANDPKDDMIEPTQIDGHEKERLCPLSRKDIFKKILENLRFQIAVVSCKYPKREFNIEEFKQKEIDLKIFLLQYCPWVQWPPYFHLLSHVGELLEKHDSIGRASTEAKERKNKVCFKSILVYKYISTFISPWKNAYSCTYLI